MLEWDNDIIVFRKPDGARQPLLPCSALKWQHFDGALFNWMNTDLSMSGSCGCVPHPFHPGPIRLSSLCDRGDVELNDDAVVFVSWACAPFESTPVFCWVLLFLSPVVLANIWIMHVSLVNPSSFSRSVWRYLGVLVCVVCEVVLVYCSVRGYQRQRADDALAFAIESDESIAPFLLGLCLASVGVLILWKVVRPSEGAGGASAFPSLQTVQSGDCVSRSRPDKVLSWLALFSASLGLGAFTGLSFASMDVSDGPGGVFQQLLNIALGVFFCVPAFVRRSLPRGFTRKEAECVAQMREAREEDGGMEGLVRAEGGGEEAVEDAKLLAVADGIERVKGQVCPVPVRKGYCGFQFVFAPLEFPEVNRVWWHIGPSVSEEEGEEKEEEEAKDDQKRGCGFQRAWRGVTAGCGRLCAYLKSFCPWREREAKDQKGCGMQKVWKGLGSVGGMLDSFLQGLCLCWWTLWGCCRMPHAPATALDCRRLVLALLMCVVFADFTSDIAVGVQLTMAGLYEWSDYGPPFNLSARTFTHIAPDLNNKGRPRLVFNDDGSFSHYEGVAVWDERLKQNPGLHFNVTLPPVGGEEDDFFDEARRAVPVRLPPDSWIEALRREAFSVGERMSRGNAIGFMRDLVGQSVGWYVELGDFILLPGMAERIRRSSDVADVGTIQVVKRQPAQHLILRKPGSRNPTQPPSCFSDVKVRYYNVSWVDDWMHSDAFFQEETPLSNPLCLTGTVGVKHLMECEDPSCDCSALNRTFGLPGKLLCPRAGGVQSFRPSFWCGLAILFLSMFDMLNVVVMQVMLVNPKSFKRLWLRFLFSFLLSTTEVFILGLSIWGWEIESNKGINPREFNPTLFYFQIVSTVLVVLWKCVRVVFTRFNLCKGCRKIDKFLEKEPAERVELPKKKGRGEGKEKTNDRRTDAAAVVNTRRSGRRSSTATLATDPSARSVAGLDIQRDETRGEEGGEGTGDPEVGIVTETVGGREGTGGEGAGRRVAATVHVAAGALG
uniref:Uncharacterized protein n=1 Tax=Chromera velia CCMP2878 TaxID=1169474 RepID=A0A0G4HC39_9ALVE|eukprot:Cvel_6206.t1-p1 / transcript=Cvel_6206.t1 / gene=Cvel_6206 / organism=Chromera_velia_CCMP2878 / gene_product=hypothetical protein / transcript_product=hypothetical protein / location=Cvel_scaffold300:77143-81061(+) / protein_length=1000 / sequence_SO=supercontig / SO=protein_coding / is_pseudo=false